jgi:plastocyanin
MTMTRRQSIRQALLLAAGLLGLGVLPAFAQQSVTIALSIKNHRFQPAEISAPAGKTITLRIKNLDATPAEFESVSLRVEKVIAANSEGVVNIRALQPGRYNFFDDFHQEAKGVLVVQ